ncbi:4-alpha-glucanotransferase [Citrobacter portucalensis]|uniref:4-alpha-glucanotransferase n=1 Tax=Citrobacter portucalensis TaxID=1639133 RepID=UPI001C640E26|nr:4-alpha-glucanotransferase [Citrobacter portucalensis]MBW7620829.1 4-alpha-glucanotransferase [Citrobacter portucalensis]MBW7639999.1 4-alpha-glucanotransferase [Citrobacter portucalensis]MCA2133960.1 4-alpha-glucanotransferase [Citrobacter portucalensis]MCA2144741.1 4-alpha-glucanotransferase [Citrobacter portucalensis]MCA2148927.1 4-alpha-glucanotransferase [Citrobacter portucalensis]
MESKRLDNAALAAGISPNYINAHGKPQSIGAETKRRLLDAMHRTTAATQVAVTPVPNVMVYTAGKKMPLAVEGSGEFNWLLTTEEGVQHKGHAVGGKSFNLPAKLPEGYHTLTLTQGELRSHCRIIVAPKRCYEPQALLAGQKLWGACVQLYTLRSENNWGIGDFGDLRTMLVDVAQRGGAFIGLNPIHALYPANPESASPYSPSSRRWLNVIYIDVNAVDDFRLSKEAQAWWKKPATQQALQRARDAEWVDYSAVTALKMTALRMAWKSFSARDDEQMAAFRQFVAQEGDSLYWQAAFDALHAYQVKEDALRWGWPVWPEVFQSVDSPEVKRFCEEHRDDVDFYLWLQWLAYTQFADCWKTSQGFAMPIGLYRDLAVGVAEGGAETWCDRELYCLKASVGAPPDILGPLGQNWGLPPMDPHIITARAYEPFIELLRANMQNCGALRIDHVMSMLRLWWIPYGETADHGAYVHYPVDDLLSILALESKRHHCMVIGEDLGTVPVEIVSKLRDSGVYSYKVLYFENDHEKNFRAPKAYPEQSMAVAATHDLPTLKGYWDSGDLTLGKALGLYPDEVVLRGLYQDRELAKQGLLDALHKYGCLPKRAGHKASLMLMTPILNRGMQRYIADSNSALLGLQPEDWLDMAEPVNIPGTSDQYKNWRRKLTATLEQMFADEGVNKLIKDLDKRRKAAAKKK